MKRCKCGTMIDFITMESGKKMPVEIEKPINVAVKVAPATPPFGDFPEHYRITTGLVPHWSNCPHAKQFKKP
jgi:hypothetical protein